MKWILWPFVALWQNRKGALFFLSLVAMGVGCWLAWRPLGLIVPGAIVFGCLAWSHREDDDGDQPPTRTTP